MEANSTLTPTATIHNRPGRVAPLLWTECEEDLTIATRATSLLIRASPPLALELACELAFRIREGTGVMAVDCRAAEAEGMLDALCRPDPGMESSCWGILLLQEVHALSRSSQLVLADALEQWRDTRPHRTVIASSSVALFDRLQAGAFDDRLFYRLNTISLDLAAACRRVANAAGG